MSVYVIVWSWYEDWEVVDVTDSRDKAIARIKELDPSVTHKYDDTFHSHGGIYRFIEKQVI